jgi:NAD-dependent deacetylase
MRRRKILIFTGAGVSAESGVKTFRDNDGLWNDFKVEEVATIYAWHDNPQKVVDFYNLRRKEMIGVLPNDAHKTIFEMEKDFDVTVVTQNVDDLHEKAGSTKIIHLHGELANLRGENSGEIIPYDHDLTLDEVDEDGGNFRPDVVWFGESLDHGRLQESRKAANDSDICIIIGTTMKVAPAAEIPFETPDNAIIYYIDPSEMDFTVPKMRRPFFYHIQKGASEGIKEVLLDIKDIFNIN